MVKGPDIYILPRTGKPEQQRFSVQSDVLTSISSRQRSAICSSTLPKLTDLDLHRLAYYGPGGLSGRGVFTCVGWQVTLCGKT